MKMKQGRKQSRRGSVAVIVIIVLLMTGIFIVGIVSGGARDHEISARRLETVQAFYAAEAGVNMALRELRISSDEDADGTIGSISDDAADANDPVIGGARVMVSLTSTPPNQTIASQGRSGQARRKILAVVN